jgi:predicted membrane protein
MLNRTLLTSDKIIKLKLVIGTTFRKVIRLKNKNRSPIDISTWSFRSQFVNNFTEDDVLCRLTVSNELISINPLLGEITIIVPSEVTSALKNYDTGDWSIEYSLDSVNWLVLMQGKWSAESTLLVNWVEPEVEEEPVVEPEPEEPTP